LLVISFPLYPPIYRYQPIANSQKPKTKNQKPITRGGAYQLPVVSFYPPPLRRNKKTEN